jgi:hypothetical protein
MLHKVRFLVLLRFALLVEVFANIDMQSLLNTNAKCFVSSPDKACSASVGTSIANVILRIYMT